jgi:hypothetical protein
VPFRANTGQDDPRVAYAARTLDGTLFVTRGGQIVHSFPGKPIAVAPRGTRRRRRDAGASARLVADRDV